MPEATFSPLADRVLIRRDEAQAVTKGGVILAEQAVPELNTGTVVSAGPGSRALDGSLIPRALNTGDSVFFSQYAGQEILLNGEEFILLREQDVLGIVG